MEKLQRIAKEIVATVSEGRAFIFTLGGWNYRCFFNQGYQYVEKPDDAPAEITAELERLIKYCVRFEEKIDSVELDALEVHMFLSRLFRMKAKIVARLRALQCESEKTQESN
jgi:hypothetical protein